MASTSPTRRPLSERDQNASTIVSHSKNLQAYKSISTSRLQHLSEATTTDENHRTTQETPYKEIRLDGKKRNSTDGQDDVRQYKRRQISIIGEVVASENNGQYVESCERKVARPLEQNVGFGNDVALSAEPQTTHNPLEDITSPGPEAVDSPASSCPSSTPTTNLGINDDSQNTLFTHPDEHDARDVVWSTHLPANSRLTPEQVREKAKEIKLRLSLANYKVKTNQMDTPISRLQIRPSALPSALSSRHLASTRLQSPQGKANANSCAGLSTPILPRQRNGLLNPPSLGSPLYNNSTVTSSVVKGRAADGLLSLMRHQG